MQGEALPISIPSDRTASALHCLRIEMKTAPFAAMLPQLRGHSVRVVVETPKHGRNKYDFDPKLQAFVLNAVLPSGAAFPNDFGFIPQTLGEDGDPLDILLFMDEPAFPGCVVEARLIGVIEAKQAEKGRRIRNDRLLGVSAESHLYRGLKSIRDLDPRVLDEIEEFFISYNRMKGVRFKPLGRFGPARAKALVARGVRVAKEGRTA